MEADCTSKDWIQVVSAFIGFWSILIQYRLHYEFLHDLISAITCGHSHGSPIYALEEFLSSYYGHPLM
jgi:hypothetical protein